MEEGNKKYGLDDGVSTESHFPTLLDYLKMCAKSKTKWLRNINIFNELSFKLGSINQNI